MTIREMANEVWSRLEHYKKDIVYDLMNIKENPRKPFVLFSGKWGTNMTYLDNKDHLKSYIAALEGGDRNVLYHYNGVDVQKISFEEAKEMINGQKEWNNGANGGRHPETPQIIAHGG